MIKNAPQMFGILISIFVYITKVIYVITRMLSYST